MSNRAIHRYECTYALLAEPSKICWAMQAFNWMKRKYIYIYIVYIHPSLNKSIQTNIQTDRQWVKYTNLRKKRHYEEIGKGREIMAKWAKYKKIRSKFEGPSEEAIFYIVTNDFWCQSFKSWILEYLSLPISCPFDYTVQTSSLFLFSISFVLFSYVNFH